MTISIVNPADFPDWDGSIRPLCGHSFFHTSAWAGTLRKSYHYTPYYFVDRTATDMKALLPLMEVNSLITGKRGVSLPFTDYCEPLVPDVARFEELFRAVLEFGKKQNWNYVEIRGGESFFHDAQPAEYHFGHTLDLTKGTDPIFLRLRDSTRRNIKKAKREGVTITLSASPDSMEEFRRLNALTRRDHGLPPQPACFFRNLFDAIISKDRGVIALASFKGKAVAANVYLHFHDLITYKYGASDRAFRHLRVNNLIMWETILWASGKGFKELCFGRSEPENEGLRQFKMGWGTQERQIKYYRYDLHKRAFVSSNTAVNPAVKGIFRSLPIPVLNMAGALLYRHMG
jgi:hypothetical protein